ncbi:hypothetical protein [Enterococcus faecalis]|uniref:Uncharacterized protein n=1 Tax=Enterococcus faecalis RP2S-4 TaxID=1244145 RepID=A0ABC9TJD6_ENTFL|nr:hypothetical protein [Enterococcus faecalis]EPI08730.1 hypothetical protein D358_01505 [Enterococcus faecalis RP2S-4]
MNIKRKYQLIYGYVLYAKEPIYFNQTGEKINGLLINIKFGTIFTADELKHQKIQPVESFLSISYNSQSKTFTYALNEEYKDGFEIVGYELKITDTSGQSTTRQSTKEDVKHLVQTYEHYFLNDNRLQPLTLDYRPV